MPSSAKSLHDVLSPQALARFYRYSDTAEAVSAYPSPSSHPQRDYRPAAHRKQAGQETTPPRRMRNTL